MANPQRKPHEQDVLLQATRRQFIGYFGTGGQIGDHIPIHERPAQPPKGTVYEREYTLYQDILEEDGTPIEDQQLQSQRGSAKFLRGRVVTGREALGYAPSVIQSIWGLLDKIFTQENIKEALTTLRVVVARDANDIEIVMLLEDDEVPPPAGAPEYAVGESPEEMAVADAKAYAEGAQDDLEDDEDPDDEIAAIRRNLKKGSCVDLSGREITITCADPANGEPTDGQAS